MNTAATIVLITLIKIAADISSILSINKSITVAKLTKTRITKAICSAVTPAFNTFRRFDISKGKQNTLLPKVKASFSHDLLHHYIHIADVLVQAKFAR